MSDNEKGEGEAYFVIIIAVFVLFLACRFGPALIYSLFGG